MGSTITCERGELAGDGRGEIRRDGAATDGGDETNKLYALRGGGDLDPQAAQN